MKRLDATALRAFAIAFAAFWLVLLAVSMFVSPPSLYSGVHLVFTGALVQPNVVRVDRDSPAYRAGLRSGDVLGCLSPRDYALLLNPSFGYEQGYRPGTVISTCAHRNGAAHRVQFVAQSRGAVLNLYGNDVLLALRLCVFIVFVLTGTALVMARPSVMTWIFYAYCIGNAPAQAALQVWSILPAWQYTIAELTRVAPSMASPLLLLFTLLVPSDRIPQGWRRVGFQFASSIAAADLLLVLVSIFYTDVTMRLLRNDLDQMITVLTVLIIVARLVTMERTERTRFGWAAFGIAFGVVVNDVRNVFIALPWLNVAAAELTVVTPLCLMYAILRRHVIDVQFVLNRAIVLVVIGIASGAIFAGLDWLFAALPISRLQTAIALAVAFAFGLLVAKTYAALVAVVDSVFFPRRHAAARQLNQLRFAIEKETDRSGIGRMLTADTCDVLSIASVALFSAADDGGFVREAAVGWGAGTAWHLFDDDTIVRQAVAATRKTLRSGGQTWKDVNLPEGAARPVLTIPLFSRRKTVALVVYGAHTNGSDIDPDETRGLVALCRAAAPMFDQRVVIASFAAAVVR